MADADALLRAGDLDGARAALVEAVRRAPSDQPVRMFLFQLLCVSGEWDKASAQLRALAQLSPEAQMLAVAYNQAVEAELFRAKVFAGEAQPALLVKSSAWAGDLAGALAALCQGRTDDAAALRDQAFDAAPDTPGDLDGTAFDWIADGDTRFGPAMEAIIAGQWGLLPFDCIEKIESEGPKDLRDIVWYPGPAAASRAVSPSPRCCRRDIPAARPRPTPACVSPVAPTGPTSPGVRPVAASTSGR